MELNLIHALILTQFESTLTNLDFDTLVAQDYTVHGIYCKETKSLIYHSEPQNFNGYEEVIKIQQTLQNLPILVNWGVAIVIIGEDENEYRSCDVLKHF